MRVTIAGPKGWKRLEKRLPEETSLAKRWMETQLELESLRNPDLMVATSLLVGLDTTLASICVKRGIPFRVFLSCHDQERFWDPETITIFHYLLEKAESTVYVSSGEYTPGCIKNQAEAITNWLLEDNKPLLLMVKDFKFTSTQQIRRREVERVSGNIFSKNYPMVEGKLPYLPSKIQPKLCSKRYHG